MQNVQFMCHKCGQAIKAPIETGGQIGQCPKCATSIQIPQVQSNKPTPVIEQSATRQGPIIIGTIALLGVLIFAVIFGYVLSKLDENKLKSNKTSNQKDAVTSAEKESPLSKRLVVEPQFRKESLACAEAFNKYLNILSSPTPEAAYPNTSYYAFCVFDAQEKYPKNIWLERASEAIKKLAPSKRCPLPLSDWVSEKYPTVKWDVIEVRKLSQERLRKAFDEASGHLYNRVIAGVIAGGNTEERIDDSVIRGYEYYRILDGFTVFYKLMYTGPSSPVCNGNIITEVLCKSDVFWTACGLHVQNPYPEFIESKSIAPSPIDYENLCTQVKQRLQKNPDKGLILWISKKVSVEAMQYEGRDDLPKIKQDILDLEKAGFEIKERERTEKRSKDYVSIKYSVIIPEDLVAIAYVNEENRIGIKMVNFINVYAETNSTLNETKTFKPDCVPSTEPLRDRLTYNIIYEPTGTVAKCCAILGAKRNNDFAGIFKPNKWLEMDDHREKEEGSADLTYDPLQKEWRLSQPD